MFSSEDTFAAYIQNALGFDATKKSLVKSALNVTFVSVLNRQDWQFAYKEDSFTVSNGVAKYDLGAKFEFPIRKILAIRVNDNPPLTYLPPKAFDERKTEKVFNETEQTGAYEAWTVKERGTGLAPKIEIYQAPDNANDLLYVHCIQSLTDEIKTYLLTYWSNVLVAGVMGCLKTPQIITTPTGSVIKQSALGQPDGYGEYEIAIREMENNEPIVEEFSPAPGDSDWTNLYEFLDSIN